MEYIVDGRKFTLNYSELRGMYRDMCDLSDTDFMECLPEALHLACVICYLKEVSNEHSISDVGIVHELVHLLSDEDYATRYNVAQVRQNFRETLQLA